MDTYCYEHEGLNAWARKFVAGKRILEYTLETTRVYPDGRREASPPQRIYRRSVQEEASGEIYYGDFFAEEGGYPLNRYIFPDGRVFVEAVQMAPGDGGPTFHLALKDSAGNWVPESLWPWDGSCGVPEEDHHVGIAAQFKAFLEDEE